MDTLRVCWACAPGIPPTLTLSYMVGGVCGGYKTRACDHTRPHLTRYDSLEAVSRERPWNYP